VGLTRSQSEQDPDRGVGKPWRDGEAEADVAPAETLACGPHERARANLALLYGGTGRTFEPRAVLGPAPRRSEVTC
jgi:hypothetical protein